MPPRTTDYDRNDQEERQDLAAYEQGMSEKANALTELIVDMRYVRRDVQQIKDGLAKNYVTQEAFEPVKKLVYTTAGLMLTSVVGAIMALILR